MKRTRSILWAGWLATAMLLDACAQPADGPLATGAPATETPATGAPAARPPVARPPLAPPSLARPWAVVSRRSIDEVPSPRASVPLIVPGERRVALFVLPGDASIEVDGQLVARRNGVVDLIGKVGDVHRVRVFKGEKSTEEKTVTVQDRDASPALIDLNETASRGEAKGRLVRFGFNE